VNSTGSESTVLILHVDVPILTPEVSPGVLDDVVLFVSGLAPTDSSDSMGEWTLWAGTVVDTRSVVHEAILMCVDSHSGWTLVDSGDELGT
jgi:hypothetical protein